MHERPAILDVLPGGYQRIFERAVAVFEVDERVRGMWLGGSLARGDADAASDLDLILAIADEAFDEFHRTWRTWLAEITPTVLAEELAHAPGILYSVTPDFERLDIVSEPAGAVPNSGFPRRAVVFDHDDLTSHLPPAPQPGPNAHVVRGLVVEFFRTTGMPEVLLEREDWLLGALHMHYLRDSIYKLFVERNQPLPPMGVKRHQDRLTPDQREVLLEIPTTVQSKDELLAAHLAASRAFVGTARPLAEELGIEWPMELEAAARTHFSSFFECDDPYPG